MIFCENISKSFGEQAVLHNFTYNFNTTGLYVLLGESGSGKTTLLNILAGLIPFDKGKIHTDNTVYNQTVEMTVVQKDVEYITQDSYFVNYLSVFDNLKLISRNELIIYDILKRFGLSDKANRFPETLSGGEKQRLALARAILKNKKVFLLDEPTASLDEKNKTEVFEALYQIKNEALIICATHDTQANKYADSILYFSKTKTDNTNNLKQTIPINIKNNNCNNKDITIVTDKTKIKNLNGFIKKWFVSDKRNKKSSVLFIIFLVISMCICIFSDTPENKLNSSIENMYKLNMLTIITTGNTNWEQVNSKDNRINKIVLDYNRSCPNGTENLSTDDIMVPEQSYEISLNIIPSDKNNFKLADQIIYGTYFTSENQIILSSEMANAIYPSNPEKLIGEHIVKTIYGLGDVNFEIIGIFDYFNDFEKMYLSSMGIDIARGNEYNELNYAHLFFASSMLTDNFENDKNFYSGSSAQRCYLLFFDSYKEMKSYYDDYAEELNSMDNIIVSYNILNGNLSNVFNLLFCIMLPIAIFMAFFTCMFYATLKKTEFIYNSSFISVFEYSGYKKKQVINKFIFFNIIEMLKLCAIAGIITFAITIIVNIVNRKTGFVNFQIFSYNPIIIISFFAFLTISTIIFTNVFFRKVKASSWFDILISNRDLI